MRQIEFPDESFDFACSSSAARHIGGWDDLKAHLSEVKRVLKPGGVYVMTTDFIYGPPIHTPGGMKFDAEGLERLLQVSGMDYRPIIDCRVTEHLINTPLPSNLIAYMAADGEGVQPDSFWQLAHVQLLGSGHPCNSVVLEMRKAATDRPRIEFVGLEETTTFLKQAQRRWERLIERSNLSPNPAPNMPREERDQRWATTYMWLGSRPRIVVVHVQTNGPGKISIGVNKRHAERPQVPVIDIQQRAETTPGHIEFEFTLNCDRACTYAIYGRALDGLKLTNVHVSVRPSGEGTPVIVRRALAPDRAER